MLYLKHWGGYAYSVPIFPGMFSACIHYAFSLNSGNSTMIYGGCSHFCTVPIADLSQGQVGFLRSLRTTKNCQQSHPWWIGGPVITMCLCVNNRFGVQQ